MGFTEVLTLIFVVCKILGIGVIANWNWFCVLLPEIIAVIVYISWIVIAYCFAKGVSKRW